MSPAQYLHFSESVGAVVFFVSNIFFWRDAGYFSPNTDLQPLLHTWSLAVEEQYYLLFPLLLAFLHKFGRRIVLSFLCAALLSSIVLSQWGATNKPDINFYFTLSRFWELAAGSICAFPASRRGLGSSDSLSFLGLVLISISIFFYDKAIPFPSLYTLTPVVGTTLILIFCSTDTICGKFLSSRIMVGIGLVSYSSYLWHQPLFAFYRLHIYSVPDQPFMMMLAALSILLGYLSWRYVERPFRTKLTSSAVSQRQLIAFSTLGASVLLGFSFLGYIGAGLEFRLTRSENAGILSFAQSTTRSGKLRLPCTEVGLSGIERVATCSFLGNNQKKTKLAVYGDSHAIALFPGFRDAFETDGFNTISIAAGGCPPLLDTFVLNGNYHADVCRNIAQSQFDFAIKNNIQVVFLVARWSLYTEQMSNSPGGLKSAPILLSPERNNYLANVESSRRAFSAALVETLKQYNAKGVQVVLVNQVPPQTVNPSDFAERLVYSGLDEGDLERLISKNSVSAADADSVRDFSKSVMLASVSKGVGFLSFDTSFRRGDIYSLGEKTRSFYSDNNHLSKFGAEFLARDILEIVRAITVPSEFVTNIP